MPRHPFSCSVATTNVVNSLINAIQSAMAQAGGEVGLAEGGVSMGAGFAVISGQDRRRGVAPYVNQGIVGSNGGPASAFCDGWVTYCLPDCAKTPVSGQRRDPARDCGGGGYGDPREREPQRELHDVLEGWVSVEQAESIYGVSLRGSVEAGSLAAIRHTPAAPTIETRC